MYQIHPNARTTPAVRAEIARSTEPSGDLAKRYGVSTETIRKWRKRGAEDCRDHSSRPTHLRWRATDEERAIVCHLRRMTGFALDDLTFIVAPLPAPPQPRQHLPHPQSRRVGPPRRLITPGKSRAVQGVRPGFVHMDIKHLPKLHGSAWPDRASATSTSRSTAPRARFTSPSRTRRPKPAPPPS